MLKPASSAAERMAVSLPMRMGVRKVPALSYSTFGSGKGPAVDKMRNAAEKAKAAMPEVPIEGELQFDAAVSRVPDGSPRRSKPRFACSGDFL